MEIHTILSYVLFLNLFIRISGLNFERKQQRSGESCRLGNGQGGICKPLGRCDTAQISLANDELPEICSYENFLPIVCCPEIKENTLIVTSERPTTKTTVKRQIIGLSDSGSSRRSMSETKCREYGKAVFSLERSPSLLPGSSSYINISNCAFDSKELIVGGTKTIPKEFPHMALIGFGERDNIFWGCGGSLISERFVLTAGHCIIDTEPSEIGPAKFVRLGERNLSDDDPDAEQIQDFQIVDRFVHPDYKPPLKYNDIALVKLHREADFNGYVRPACLHIHNTVPKENPTATGWGRTKKSGSRSEDLLKVQLSFADHSYCERRIRAKMSPRKFREILPNGINGNSMVCAGSLKTIGDTCQGDSGGPLQIVRNDPYCTYNVIGITSFGVGCGSAEIPAVYTRVSYYVPWIENIIWV